MTSANRIDIEAIEAEALRVHRNYPKGWSPTVLVDPATVQVGDKVIAYGHGGWRMVVVTKVGPKRMTGRYTTPSAVTEGRKTWERTMNLSPATQSAHAHRNAARSYDYTVQCSTREGQLSFSYMRPYANEDDATFEARLQGEVSKAQARLAEMGERGEFVANEARKAHERTTEQMERARTGGWQQYVLFTNNSSTWDRVYAS